MMRQFFESLRAKYIAHRRSWWNDAQFKALPKDDQLLSCTPLKTNVSPENLTISKRKQSSNHRCSRAMLAIGWVYFWSCPSLAGHFNLNFGQFFVFNKYSPCFHSRKHANTNKSCHVQSSTQYLSTCPWSKKQPSKRFLTFQHLPTSFWWGGGWEFKIRLQIHGI